MSQRPSDSVLTWLEQVPSVEGGVDRVRGRLVRVTPVEVVIQVGETCLSFARNDVLRVVPAQFPRESTLHLRPCSPVLSARVAPDAAGVARRPFALCARPSVTRAAAAPRLRELEREFLRAHGHNLGG